MCSMSSRRWKTLRKNRVNSVVIDESGGLTMGQIGTRIDDVSAGNGIGKSGDLFQVPGEVGRTPGGGLDLEQMETAGFLCDEIDFRSASVPNEVQVGRKTPVELGFEGL